MVWVSKGESRRSLRPRHPARASLAGAISGGASPNNTWDTATSRTLPAILNWHRIDSKIFGVIDRKGYLRLATEFSAVWAYTPVWLNRR